MQKPVAVPPAVTDESRSFWEAAEDGHFVVERCAACGEWNFPPAGVCRRCAGREMVDQRVSGPGTVYSFTINHQRWTPEMDTPFGLALVEFPDPAGVRLLGWVESSLLDEVSIGVTVDLEFATTTAGWPIPTFRPAHG